MATDKEKASLPPLPIEVTTALKEGVQYVDATALIAACVEHLKRTHEFAHLVGQALVRTNETVIELHRKTIELEAEIAAMTDPRPPLIIGHA